MTVTPHEQWQDLMRRWDALDSSGQNQIIGWLANADPAEFCKALDCIERSAAAGQAGEQQ